MVVEQAKMGSMFLVKNAEVLDGVEEIGELPSVGDFLLGGFAKILRRRYRLVENLSVMMLALRFARVWGIRIYS
jgi:chorismate-pyruvate lyase